MPITLDQIVDEIADETARFCSDVGLYLDPVQGDDAAATVSRVYLQGIRKGLRVIGVAPADPINPTDADLVNLSPFAMERVLNEAIRYTLARVALNWDLAVQNDGTEANASSEDTRGGWRYAQKQALQNRIAALDTDCSGIFREPGPAIVVNEPELDYRGTLYSRDYYWGGCW